ncbi:Armadillo-type fold [Amanita muscaria]
METVVPPEITAELTQILSNLVLGDNEIRQSAENAVNDRLARSPEMYLLALAQFAIAADTEVLRSFSLVLLRRLLFRASPSLNASGTHTSPAPIAVASRPTLYDHLSSATLEKLERILLHSLEQEPATGVRHKSVDTACDMANEGMRRGRPWHALQVVAFRMAAASGVGEGPQLDPQHGQIPGLYLRESAFRVFAGSPNLVVDLQTEAVLNVFQRGLQDPYSIEVRHAAILASVAYLTAADTQQLSQSTALLSSMLETLPALAQHTGHIHPSSVPPPAPSPTLSPNSDTSYYSHLSTFLTTLTPLCSSHPYLFQPHLPALLSFLPALILPTVDAGPTPTVGRPFPSSSSSATSENGRQSVFVFPPSAAPSSTTTLSPPPPDRDIGNEEEDERSTLRLSALEFMISLSEAKPGMVKKVPGWTDVIVRACLEGMSELEDDGLDDWLSEDPSAGSSSADTESPPALYEQSLDRLACALGGRAVLPPAFQFIPSMLASFDWRARHAGLMAIAAIGEGTGRIMQNELGNIVKMVVPLFRDSHPRVRYAACQCIGQLCTDLEEIIQERYHQQLFAALVPSLEDPEPRVHTHAAAALINFCEGVERDTLVPYLDPIVERLLKLLNPGRQVHRYVQEQVITTLAMVADASEATFAKHYSTIMPLLMDILRNADSSEYHKLRVKAMECAGLVAIAVGREIFLPDSTVLIEQLMRIQKSPIDPSDTQLQHYLIATWAKVCQAMGPEFEPYLPIVMPTLLSTAGVKADISVFDDEATEEREGWETISVDGQALGIRTAVIEEKCQAFETLIIYCSTLNARFAPYLAQTLEVTLPSLKFYFHEGVREACALLIPLLLVSGQNSGTLTTQMVSATLTQLVNCINTEQDASFLASLYKAFADSVRVIGGVSALPQEYQTGIIEATQRQLHNLAERRKVRANHVAADPETDREDMVLVEEFEDFALDDMTKLLSLIDPNHSLLIAVSSVRDLGMNSCESDADEEEES